MMGKRKFIPAACMAAAISLAAWAHPVGAEAAVPEANAAASAAQTSFIGSPEASLTMLHREEAAGYEAKNGSEQAMLDTGVEFYEAAQGSHGKAFSVFCVSLVVSLALMFGIFGLFVRRGRSGHR
ncbi:hypothetical protein [Saccharibacillus alkalitolerans]|uniref:Uncharacterized protein n=1 Tax=Saccharibacillus alkalitolerans TaxID=2705290 RepID=A0ABX0FCL9_9BACL|nr:hypothetical protein [Saccharibacillus alkalitolerans]NGZ77343.1 hypothetical protein [Saccharibacillus alkalitolerans]